MLVELKDAEIGHEDIPILSHVGLTVDEGEFVYLIGKVGTVPLILRISFSLIFSI